MKENEGKWSVRKRLVIVLAVVLTMCIQLTGCYDTELAEGFDEKEIKAQAEELLNEMQMNGVKQVLEERMRDDFKENMDMDTMQNTVTNLTKGKGGFLAYSEESVIGRYHEEAKEDFGVILVTATYEKGEVVYTITFDKDMNVVGFYAK